MIYVKTNGGLYPAKVAAATADAKWDGRETKTITIECSFAEADALFPDGAAWSVIIETPGRDGKLEQTEVDYSAFNVRGDVIVRRDGTCEIKMGKRTETEAIRRDVEVLLPSLTDEMAATVPNLYPPFAVGKAYSVGDRLSFGGVLYRVLQNHTSQADWAPDVAVSLFAKV